MTEALVPRLSLVPGDSNAECSALLATPFTPAAAAAVGLGRAGLDRLVRDGEAVRLLRGVYLGVGVPVSAGVRVQALGLVIGRRQTVVGRTAAWLHGASAESVSVGLDRGRGVPVELRAPRVRISPTELTDVAGVRCTTAVRTAADLADRLPPGAALAALDGLLWSSAIDHTGLLRAAEMAGADRARARDILARGDGRSRGPAESVLRLHWLDARLPTPTPGLVVAGQRTALALPTHRFAAVVVGQFPPAARDRWEAEGWRVRSLAAEQVLGAEPAIVRAHLEREFHQHLLGQVGVRTH